MPQACRRLSFLWTPVAHEEVSGPGIALNEDASQVCDMLAALVRHARLADDEVEGAVSLTVDVGDSALEAQPVPDIGRGMIGERLFAVQRPGR